MNLHCAVMMGDEACGYFKPRGYCRNPIAYQHDDSKVYCAEHAHVARELDISWALEQQKRIDKEKLYPLVSEWMERRMPLLPDRSLHPMDVVQRKCAEQLRKLLDF